MIDTIRDMLDADPHMAEHAIRELAAAIDRMELRIRSLEVMAGVKTPDADSLDRQEDMRRDTLVRLRNADRAEA